MTRYVAFLRAVNLGRRRVAMQRACEILTELGFSDVGSWVNSGNLLLTTGKRRAAVQSAIQTALEDEHGFEITTFLRTGDEVRALATDKPFGAVAGGHTHFVLMSHTPLSAADIRAVEGMSNDHDRTVVIGGDVHWLIRSKSTETTLGPKQWAQALPGNPTTARNVTMVSKLAQRL